MNYLLNSLQFLSCIANGRTAQKLIDELATPTNEKRMQFERNMHEIALIENMVRKRSDIPQNELEFYFRDISSRDTSIAMQLFFHTAVFFELSVEDAIAKLRSCSNEYIWRSIASAIGTKNETHDSPTTYEEFIKTIVNESVSQNETISALSTLIHRSEYVEAVGKMLVSVQEVLLEISDVVMPIMTRAQNRYSSPAFFDVFQESQLFDISVFETVTVNISLFFNDGLLIEFNTSPKKELIIVTGVYSWDMVALRRTIAAGEMSTEDVAKILSDKTRLDIMSYLKDNESYGQELSRKFGLSRNTIYKHLSKLCQASLVKSKYTKKNIYYSSNIDMLKKFIEQLAELLVGKAIHWDD